MRVLITGAQGQLGKDLEKMLLGAGGYEVISTGQEQLDITKAMNVQQEILACKPEIIIHTAANTNVDQCELDKDNAFFVNVLGTRNVAVAAAKADARLVYISTDYVFDGRGKRPYTEFDAPAPLSVYGKSKLAGERQVKNFSDKFFIVRTSWLYGLNGNNFVKTMLNLAKEKSEISVVNDQIGTPTFTQDLARFLEKLIQTDLYGVYHASNSGSCSWFDFALTIFRQAGIQDRVNVMPITTAELNRAAPRPSYSVLDNYCLKLEGFPNLRPWEEALEEFMKKQLLI